LGVPVLLLCALFATPLAETARAGLGEECAELEFNGAAGAGSQDKVTIKVVDLDNPTIALSQSCVYTVENSESAVEFLRRIPSQWGDGAGTSCQQFCTGPALSPLLGTPCTLDSNCDTDFAGDGVCGNRSKKVCGNTATATGFSCTVEARISQKKGKCINNPAFNGKGCKTDADCGAGGECPADPSDGHLRPCDDAVDGETCLTKPAVLRVCCRESNDCSGKKLDEVSFGVTPITIQTKVEPVPALVVPDDCLNPPAFCPKDPDDLPDNGVVPRTIAIDPIGGRSGPYRSVRDCRAPLLSATGAVSQTTFNALKECHRKVMAGTIPGSSCGTVNPTSDPEGSVSASLAALHNVVAGSCQQSGHSPSDFGYTSCPPPCDSNVFSTCTAGTIGMPCLRDRNCDTAPALRDGRCGDWNGFESCVACQAKAVGIAATAAAYGVPGPGPGLPTAVQTCQSRIGDGIATLFAATRKDAEKCQRESDEFRRLLSERTPKCKDADSKGKRKKVRDAVAADLSTVCTNAALAQLDSCSSNLAGLRHCAPRIVVRAIGAVADAAAPESRCGDGLKALSEKCDDGNVVDGDGCDSNCTPTICGNGVISTGEECDDGDIKPGDGCDPSCHSEPQPCAPQMCGNFDFDCSALFPGDCVCLQSAEGGGLCVNNFDCTAAQPCSSSVDCTTPGERCYLQTCCGGSQPGRCGPPTCTGQPG
jgi:cysteine-rich repeat protein